MSIRKRVLVITAILLITMVMIPLVVVQTVRNDAGMLVMLLLFYLFNPVVSVMLGWISGKDIMHFWPVPLVLAIVFWLFSSVMHQVAFPIVYSVIYFAVCALTMVIVHFFNRK